MTDPVVLLSTGDVVGPNSSTDGTMVLFDGTSGKKLKGNNAVVTAQGLALLDDVDAAANRATIGLGNANNTSDLNKPISTATQTALDLKVAKDSDTGSAYIPAGSTAQRSVSSPGRFRYNTDTNRAEINNGSAWNSLGGATGGNTDAVFYLNDQVVNNDFTVVSNQNAGTFGPITVANGKTVTIASGAVWTVV